MTLTIVGGKGVCAAKGYRAAGVTAGIKKSGAPDLALIVSDSRASVAGTFTTNRAAAAPVLVTRDRVAQGYADLVVVNSGCANAMTGAKGRDDALEMADRAAKAAGSSPEGALVCSTGAIGVRLPMDKIARGIEAAAAELSREDSGAMAAIMTTDSRPKSAAVAHSDGWSVGGICKGAGMIAPNMATMLAFITADVVASPEQLQGLLGPIVASTFNAVTVDGDTSTNDTVLLFANGASGSRASDAELSAALEIVCRSLAEQIVSDGEGATKLIRVRVRGARDETQAKRAARAVAESLLVKTAMYGGDPNWGRVAAALGKSGVDVNIERLSIAIAGIGLLEEGEPAPSDQRERSRAGLAAASEIVIACDLFVGEGSAEILTTDLSPRYVELNAEYET